MNAQKLIERVWRVYRGKGTSKTPVWGSEKSAMALDIANQKQEDWAKDTMQHWASLFSATAPYEPGTVATTGTTDLTGTNTYFTDYQVGDKIIVDGETERIIDTITSDTALTVTVAFSNTASGKDFYHRTIIKAGVQEYKLHRSFIVPSDEVFVKTSTQDTPLATENPQKRQNADVYISGRDPKRISFYNTIEATNQIVGGELRVAGYYLPEEMTATTDSVAVDDPNWLVLATAAELARNDAAKEDQFANLIGMANEAYLNMIKANNNIGFLQGGTIPIHMPAIGDKTDNRSI